MAKWYSPCFGCRTTQVQFETCSISYRRPKPPKSPPNSPWISEIGGVNTTVAQVGAQLENAKWELEQRPYALRANDGVVTSMALAVGDRALQARSALSFIVSGDVTLIAMFSPNGFETIKPDARVKIVYDSHPGRMFEAKVLSIPRGVGQGQVAVSGTIARGRFDRWRKAISPKSRFRRGLKSSIKTWHARNGNCLFQKMRASSDC